MKLYDFVVQSLAKNNIQTIFLVSGSGIMHLVHSVGKNPDIRYRGNCHEPA
jgi:thiamine pyrophosphate-dependent acetolactate synthase large subunit-like protein